MIKQHDKTTTAGLQPMRRHKKTQLDKIIGENIVAAREAHDLTRDELSEMMELTSSHVGLIERGERGATAVTLASLSKILDTPVDHFFTKHQPSANAKNHDSQTASKSKKVMSLLTCLSVQEMDVVIRVIQEVKKLKTKE